MAWSMPIVSTPYPISLEPGPFEHDARRMLESLVVPLEADDPDLHIRRAVVEDDPRRALLDRVGPDDVLVVGRCGRGRVVGLLLGSVASYCTMHAPCPVLVVPPHRARVATTDDGLPC